MSVDFIDTNVLIYLFERRDERKQQIADALVARAIEAGDARISFQVVQETLRVITGKLDPPAPAGAALSFLERVLEPLWHVMPSPELYRRCLDVQARYRLSFYDALIVAAALVSGCTRLLSEDLQDGQRIEALRIENPFR